ncbi:REF/SRPP-like protein [Cucurbita argyrosperma subsp. argyrosperma]|nr:REF/SRPP-like protein [Cucurbita argyrosperma subsp. argyrosperma]
MAARAEEGGLKYLEFVLKAAFRAAMCLLKFYGYAKDWSGPLKFGIEAMEGTVKSVVGPLYNKLHGPSNEVLKFIDRKIQRSGLKDTVTSIMRSVYPKAEQSAASAWHALNQLPVFPTVAQAIVPTAALCTEKYNDTVRASAEKDNKVASLLPLVPTEGIAKVFDKIKI